MPGVTYQRSSPASRLFVSSQAPIWSAFLLSDQSSYDRSSIPLTACWREKGAAFLFAPQAPASLDPEFFDALREVIRVKVRNHQNLHNAQIFLRDPDALPTPDNTWLLPVRKDGNNDFRVNQDMPLLIGNGFAELRLKENAEVSIHFTADSSEIRFEKGVPNPFELYIQDQIVRPQQLGDKVLTLPLTGPDCGRFRFDLYLTPDEQLPGYDLGLKYFFEETIETNGDDPAVTHRQKALRELHFPLFRKGAANTGVFFEAGIDPAQLLNPERTHLAFTGQTKGLSTLGQTTATAFDTPFKTLKGYPIRLHPRPGSARLVFSQRCNGDEYAHYYFVPAGDFTVEILAQNGRKGLVDGHAKWLTGYAGTETLLFPYDEGKVALRFHPHQPAFAPVFPPPPTSHTNRLEMTDPLSDHCHTAWLSIVHDEGKPVRHVSQPDGGPIYKPDLEDANTPVFDYIDTTIELSGDLCLPFVPHDGQHAAPRASNGARPRPLESVQTGQPAKAASTLPAQLEVAFENQVLSAGRKFQVDQLPADPAAPTHIVHSTTPQGNLIKLQPQGNKWTELLIGEDQAGKNGQPNNQLRFDHPPLPLQKAFQTNQQFLVITNTTHLGALSSTGANSGPVFRNELEIDGWPFIFNTGENQRLGDYKNVLIFKFCNESILERIQNPALWTQPRDFNGAKSTNPSDLELQLTSRWLQDYIQDAIENQADNPYFREFIKIVQNPGWNGVLALKVDIKLDGLPTALQGLVGGIDTTRFNAHHVGMEINQVENTGNGALQYKKPSSLFGLVYYQDPNYQRLMQGKTGTDPDRASRFAPETFDFKVLTLFAQFKNSQIIRFSSKIRVTMRELFREKVQPNTVDFIDLDGTHEEKDGKDIYTFLSDKPVQFYVGSGLYQYIEIDRATFVTHPREENSRMVRSSFSFIGNLLFGIPQADFDILSFGSAPGDEETNPGLAFSNLKLHFSFSLDSPTVRSFHADYSLVIPNLFNSPVRKGSLLAQLPLEPYGFITAGENADPKDFGFFPVELAGLPTVPIKGGWYGIICYLNLGNTGGLSSGGNLVSEVLLAWGLNSKPGKHSLFMGLKLPGVDPNAKALSLQGILKLSIDTLQLVSTEQGFILKLNDIGLKFLGLLKIPPGGATSFYLFGNPEDGRKEIGWYASYNKYQ